MTWDGSICLGPGWLLGLKGMLAVGLRIRPACTGLFMALAVGAHVTLTAEAWLPHSPDVMAGRGALPLIIPAQKLGRVRRRSMTQGSIRIAAGWRATFLEMKMQQFHSKRTASQLPVQMRRDTERCHTLLSQGSGDYYALYVRKTLLSFLKHC